MPFIKKDFIEAFELLLNALYGDKIAEYFSEGTKIKIRDIIFSPVKNICMIDCIIVLGKEIDISGTDDYTFVSCLVYDVAELVISDFKVNVMISYDV